MLNVVLSGTNLLTIVLLVRWFGAEAYAHYIVDLASLGLIFIVLEVVPSNYSLFRVQDDPSWQRCVAAQIVVTIAVAAALVFVFGYYNWGIFQAYSQWMILYAGTVATKRYLDIQLQSSGKLAQYLGVELLSAVVRMMLLALGYLLGADFNWTIWASLSLAALLSQLFWWTKNPSEIAAFGGVLDPLAWRKLGANFPEYPPYYFGIALKRLRDNLLPLLAEWLFVSRELLALFLLAYRGVIFAVGQVRIVESVLNHRAALIAVERFSTGHRCLVALGAQALCLIASAVLLFLSKMQNLPWIPMLVLSFMIWPIVFFTLERAKAYSTFNPSLVNGSIISYLAVVGSGAWMLKQFGDIQVTSFAWILVAAEAVAYFTIKAISRKNDVKNS